MLLLITADSFNKHDRIVSEVHEDPPCQHSRTWYLSSKSGKIRQHEIQKSHEVNRYMYVHLFFYYKGYKTKCVTSRDFSKEKRNLSNICALHMVKVIFTESIYSESKQSFEHYHDYYCTHAWNRCRYNKTTLCMHCSIVQTLNLDIFYWKFNQAFFFSLI